MRAMITSLFDKASPLSLNWHYYSKLPVIVAVILTSLFRVLTCSSLVKSLCEGVLGDVGKYFPQSPRDLPGPAATFPDRSHLGSTEMGVVEKPNARSVKTTRPVVSISHDLVKAEAGIDRHTHLGSFQGSEVRAQVEASA